MEFSNLLIMPIPTQYKAFSISKKEQKVIDSLPCLSTNWRDPLLGETEHNWDTAESHYK